MENKPLKEEIKRKIITQPVTREVYVDGEIVKKTRVDLYLEDLEELIDHAIQSAVEKREMEILEKIELIKKETQDQLKKCNNSNATSFAEDGGEHLVGRLDLCDELLNSLSELSKKEE